MSGHEPTRPCSSRPAYGTARCSTTNPPSGSPSCAPSRPTKTSWSCIPTWKPVTAASPAVSSAIAKSRWNTPSYWTRQESGSKKRRERGSSSRRQDRLQGGKIRALCCRQLRHFVADDRRGRGVHDRRTLAKPACGNPCSGSHTGVDSFERKLTVAAANQQGRPAAALRDQQCDDLRLHPFLTVAQNSLVS